MPSSPSQHGDSSLLQEANTLIETESSDGEDIRQRDRPKNRKKYTHIYIYIYIYLDRGTWQATVHGVEKSQQD